MSEAGLFVCGTADGCDRPTERIIVEGNTIAMDRTADCMDLRPSAGGYIVSGNSCEPTSAAIAALVTASFAAAANSSGGDLW